MSTIEEALTVQGVLHVSQPGGRGSQVTYTVTRGTRPDRARLRAMLGAERLAKLDHVLAVLTNEDTRGVEAVATLYGVWNDALLDGETPDDDRLIRGFMDWHPEKAIKFKADDVRNRIGFMRRNGLVPEGRGSKTQVGALL
jgi:type I restriction enzyme S subunit